MIILIIQKQKRSMYDVMKKNLIDDYSLDKAIEHGDISYLLENTENIYYNNNIDENKSKRRKDNSICCDNCDDCCCDDCEGDNCCCDNGCCCDDGCCCEDL